MGSVVLACTLDLFSCTVQLTKTKCIVKVALIHLDERRTAVEKKSEKKKVAQYYFFLPSLHSDSDFFFFFFDSDSLTGSRQYRVHNTGWLYKYKVMEKAFLD